MTVSARTSLLAAVVAGAMLASCTHAPGTFGGMQAHAVVPHVRPSLMLRPAVRRRVDVIVVGGTPAGIASALAAARRGMNVVLVSGHRTLGGVLTRGMLNQWDLNNTVDGTDIQRGIFAEIYGRIGDAFDPQHAAAVFASMIAHQPRITLLAPARVAVTRRRAAPGGTRLTAVEIWREPRHVRERLSAACFIDATDDGDLAELGGARYDVGRQDSGVDLLMQPATLMFSLEGVDWHRVLSSYSQERFGYGFAWGDRAYGYGILLGDYRPRSPRILVPDANFGHEPSGQVTVNAIDVLGVDGRSPRSVAFATQLARQETPQLIAFFRRHFPGFSRARLHGFADDLYIRETRHIEGLTWLTAQDIWDRRVPFDTVALGSFPLDVHPVTSGAVGGGGWATQYRVYGVPLRSLIVAGFANLAIVGPAISANHSASGSVRVVPTTIEEGEAAGAACALAVKRRVDLPTLARSRALVRDLQASLVAHGSYLAARG